LDIEIDSGVWPEIIEHCGFNYMKLNVAKAVGAGAVLFEDGGNSGGRCSGLPLPEQHCGERLKKVVWAGR
jgi:hypothetical protein